MIDVHQNATLSESFEGDRLRVIGNRCKESDHVMIKLGVKKCCTCIMPEHVSKFIGHFRNFVEQCQMTVHHFQQTIFICYLHYFVHNISLCDI